MSCISLALPPLSGPAEGKGVEETPLFSPPALGTKAVLSAEEIRFVPCAYTVIRFFSTNAKFGTCTVVSVNVLQVKCAHSRGNVHNLASTSVPLTLTTVQVPNLALTHMK
jgi:hypothetical protein